MLSVSKVAIGSGSGWAQLGVCKVLEAEKAGKPAHAAGLNSARIDGQIRSSDLLKAQIVNFVNVQLGLKMLAGN